MRAERMLLVLFAGASTIPFLPMRLYGVGPELMLVIGLYPTFARSFREGCGYAWLAGLLVDLQSLGAGVPHCLGYLGAAYAVSLAGGFVQFRGNPLAQGIAAGSMALLVGNVGAVLLRLGDGSHATPLLVVSAGAACVTAVVAPFAYALLDALPLVHRQVQVDLLCLDPSGRPRHPTSAASATELRGGA